MQEPSEMVNLGANATPEEVETFRQAWMTGEYPCGGLLGVVVAWFVAGLFVAVLGMLLWSR